MVPGGTWWTRSRGLRRLRYFRGSLAVLLGVGGLHLGLRKGQVQPCEGSVCALGPVWLEERMNG